MEKENIVSLFQAKAVFDLLLSIANPQSFKLSETVKTIKSYFQMALHQDPQNDTIKETKQFSKEDMANIRKSLSIANKKFKK